MEAHHKSKGQTLHAIKKSEFTDVVDDEFCLRISDDLEERTTHSLGIQKSCADGRITIYFCKKLCDVIVWQVMNGIL